MAFSIFSLVSVAFVLLATNVNSELISFNFTKFNPGNSNFTLQGDAQILGNGVLSLTDTTPIPPTTTVPTVGRALYTTPLSLWDRATGNVASFVTSFSFVLGKPSRGVPTDGLIFFLAPTNTEIPNNSESLYLGVVDSKTSINRFVGVEFDLYPNTFEPYFRHIGIDINSLISTKIVRWNWESDCLYKVSIIYDSSSSQLTVVVTDENGEISTLSQEVNLKAVLPAEVLIGFSATSITAVPHKIHSWSFTSNLITTTSSIVSDI